MGGKGSPAPAPDYTPVAQSSLDAAKLQQQTSADQLDWAKQQYADQAPLTKAYMAQMTQSSQQQDANAAADRTRYEQQYQPIEDQFNKTATGWNSPDRAQQQSGQAMADVAQQFDQARAQSTAQLESFGIDPSQTRYGALDLGTRVSQAAAQAGAGTQSRINTEATGLALEGEAINVGKGYPGQVAQAYSGATTAGSAGVTAGLNTSSTYGNLMGTPVQYGTLANQSNATGVGALQASGNYELQAQGLRNQASGQMSSGIGSLVGAGIGIAAIA